MKRRSPLGGMLPTRPGDNRGDRPPLKRGTGFTEGN